MTVKKLSPFSGWWDVLPVNDEALGRGAVRFGRSAAIQATNTTNKKNKCPYQK
jgi:hypothetical protein